MKIKRSQLKQIIKEEVKGVLWEQQEGATYQDEGFPGEGAVAEVEAFMAEYPEEFPDELSAEDRYAARFGHPFMNPPTDLDVTDPDNPYNLNHFRQEFRDRVERGELTPEGEVPESVLAANREARARRWEDFVAGPEGRRYSHELIHIPERDCPPGGCRETNIPYPPPPEREGR